MQDEEDNEIIIDSTEAVNEDKVEHTNI